MASRKSGRGKVRAGSAKATKRVVTAYRMEEPTPELRARVAFDIATISCEMGKIIGRAYRRPVPDRRDEGSIKAPPPVCR